MSFSNFGLTPSLCTPLARLGYVEPTPVQTQSIPLVLRGADLLARAQTGTGKTAAFGLPMIERLLTRGQRAGARRPRGLVLVPTRELAVQVYRALSTYGAPVQLRVAPIYGGVSMGPQVQALARGLDIVVATPGRLIDHVQRKTVDLSAVEILTLDEADRMLDMGFRPALRQLMPLLPRARQTLLFSATMSADVVRLAADFTRHPERVDVSEAQVVAPTVTHRAYPVASDRKRDLLTRVLTQEPRVQAIVFCKTKRGSNRVGQYLEQAGIRAAILHGDKSQNARTRALDDFKAGRVAALVATDIAARGLDIPQLPLVVNFDLPLVAEDYVHRVGRTGRAGLTGNACSLVSEAERGLLADIQRLLPQPIEMVVVDGFQNGRAPEPTSAAAPRHNHGHRRGAVGERFARDGRPHGRPDRGTPQRGMPDRVKREHATHAARRGPGAPGRLFARRPPAAR